MSLFNTIDVPDNNGDDVSDAMEDLGRTVSVHGKISAAKFEYQGYRRRQ